MPYIRRLVLTPEQRQELVAARDHHPRPYMREKAAALLKVADGQPAAQVAQTGLLKAHDPDVVYSWMTRYEQHGLAGLAIQPGRGRKSAFSPSAGRHRAPRLAQPAAPDA